MDQVDQMYSFLENNPVLRRDFALTENKYSNSGKEVVELPREKTVTKTIVACSCCKQIVEAKNAILTGVHSKHFEKYARIWNPKYISPTEYLAYEEDVGLVKKTVNQTIDMVYDEDGVLLCAAQISENPEKKYLHVKIDAKKVEYTCQECLKHEVHMGVKEMPVTPANTIVIADHVRLLKKQFGARLVMIGFGRKIDSAVEMVCQQLRVKYQEG